MTPTRYVTRNYGLRGGTLDATVHVMREIERQMTPAEIECRRCEFLVTVGTQPGREAASTN